MSVDHDPAPGPAPPTPAHDAPGDPAHELATALGEARDCLAALDTEDPAGASHPRPVVDSAVTAHRDLTDVVTRALERLTVDPPDDADALRARLAAVGEAHQLLARLADEHVVARAQAWAAVDAATERLGDLGPPSQVISQATAEAAAAVDADRVVLSRVDDGWLVAEAVHVDGDPDQAAMLLAALERGPVRLDYPLIEVEMLRRRRPLLVGDAAADPRGRPAHADTLAWRDYVAAPIVLDGGVVGFLHADRGVSGRALRGLDRDVLWRFAEGFADALERAVLRRRLQTQRQEMRTVATWAESRTSELSDRAISLAHDGDRDDDGGGGAPTRPADTGPALSDLLTPREIDVLEHLTAGQTNSAIARALVVSEGTVKFHVKNILRKMAVANRAEATSQYLRMKLG